MEFMYKYARLPKDRELLININSAASKLFNKLRYLDIDTLDISNYNKKYFGSYLTNLTARLQHYSYILSWSLAKSDLPYNNFVFLDYGGGSGMLSLLAKEFKLGTVIYNDIYDVSCKDAKVIGEAIGNQADYYVQGDIDDVIRFLRNNPCNAIASYDVIEHIYDIEGFFSKLYLLSGESLRVVMSSGANNFNPRIRKALMKQQLEVEYKDQEKKWGHKERDCLRAYLKVREELLLTHAQNLNKDEVEKLAKITRGMIESDIKKCVDEYLKTGEVPPQPTHPTNTCDPYTGNWMEHLMDPYHLREVLSKTGFDVEILSGYYSSPKNPIKRSLSRFANLAIYIFKKQGIRIAPFFTIYGKNGS